MIMLYITHSALMCDIWSKQMANILEGRRDACIQ